MLPPPHLLRLLSSYSSLALEWSSFEVECWWESLIFSKGEREGREER